MGAVAGRVLLQAAVAFLLGGAAGKRNAGQKLSQGVRAVIYREARVFSACIRTPGCIRTRLRVTEGGDSLQGPSRGFARENDSRKKQQYMLWVLGC